MTDGADGGTSETPTEQPTSPDSESPTDSGDNNTDQPTEQPTETPVTDDGVKYLKSDTGTQLNMILEYEIKENNGKSVIDVTLKLESYSLNVTGRDNTNHITVGNETFHFATEAINYNGTEKKTFTLAEHEFELEGGESEIPVYAVWYFNGTYNQKPLAAIIIDGSIIPE